MKEHRLQAERREGMFRSNERATDKEIRVVNTYLSVNDVVTEQRDTRGHASGILDFVPKQAYDPVKSRNQQDQLSRTCLRTEWTSRVALPKIENLLLRTAENEAKRVVLSAGGDLTQLQGDQVPDVIAAPIPEEEQLQYSDTRDKLSERDAQRYREIQAYTRWVCMQESVEGRRRYQTTKMVASTSRPAENGNSRTLTL